MDGSPSNTKEWDSVGRMEKKVEGKREDNMKHEESDKIDIAMSRVEMLLLSICSWLHPMFQAHYCPVTCFRVLQ